MSIIGSGNALLLASAAAAAAPAYEISRSLRFNSADSAYLSRTPSTAGNQTTWTLSCWFKISQPGTDFRCTPLFSGTQPWSGISIFQDSLRFAAYNGSSFDLELRTDQKLRDPSAWYHLVAVYDSSNGTSTDRARLYLNGTRITNFSTATYPGLSVTSTINGTGAQRIGWEESNNVYSNCYFSDVHFVDGQALDPTSFGEFDATTGVWNPIEYTGSYGTNGFNLTFSDNSGTSSTTLGKDAAGSNNWTPNNFSVASGSGNDSLRDSPTNGDTANDTGLGGEVPGNYCTWNPLTKGTYTNGNLDSSNTTYQIGTGTVGVSSGKWYWEVQKTDSGTTYTVVGATPKAYSTAEYLGFTSGEGFGIYFFNGNLIINGSGSGSYGAFSQGDILNVALDMDNGKVWFGKNGTWFNSGNPAAGTNALVTGLTGTYYPGVSNASGTVTCSANFGQRAFAYSAPSGGFKSLCTANLPTPTIEDGSAYMDVVTYTGNGTSQTISGLEFSPDFVWVKHRTVANSNHLEDTVRGATKYLNSNNTNAEATYSGAITAFTSDGFSVGDGGEVNASGSLVAWCWDGGSSTVSNTDGSITSSVRANASAGFSIVTYTGSSAGSTVGHGLGAAPAFVFGKRRDGSSEWSCYHQSLGNAQAIILNTTAAASNSSTWNSTSPTSTVITLGPAFSVNYPSYTHVLYCFAPVAGYSAFGSYTGNGSTDGPFVYTGFDVKFILLKQSSASGERWYIQDIARDINANDAALWPNSSDAEFSSTSYAIDFLSNGFKLRNTNASHNSSGSTYVYACFAENPFSIARAR